MFEQAKNISCKFATATPTELNGILKQFWAEARKQDGETPFGTYCNQVVGIHTLGIKMKTLSIDVKLSSLYTNHSIRATSITILDNAGFQMCHIMTVSGHKSEASIRSYASKTADNVKRAMSDSISTALHSHDIQLLQPEAPLVAMDPLTVPDLDLNELIPRDWIERLESDSEQPSTSVLAVQQPRQPLHTLQNYSVENKTANVDTVKNAPSQLLQQQRLMFGKMQVQ